MTRPDEGLAEILNSAVEEGVGAITKSHRRFKGNENFLLKHIDNKKLKKKFGELYRAAQEEGVSEEGVGEYIRDGLADYVSTGAVFDDYGQNRILKIGLKEKAKRGFFRGFGARRELKGEEYFDNVIASAQDLHDLFKTGKYSEKLKAVAEAAATLNDFGFLDNAVEVMAEHGVIDNRKYDFLKRQLRERAKSEYEKISGGIETYLMPQKMAASVLTVLGGLYIAFFGIQGFTGNAIGNSTNSGNLFGIITGIALLIIGFFFIKNGSFRKKTARHKRR